MLSHAAVFWDDEMESTSSPFFYEPHFTNGVYAFDTAVKFSGTASIRVNFPSTCDITNSNLVGQCGGSVTRTFPPSTSVYKRVYFRMSGSGPDPTTSGFFHTAQLSSTKMLKGETNIDDAGATETAGSSRHWWQMGKVRNPATPTGSRGFLVSMENVPVRFSTTDVFSSISLQDNRWYCIETHEQMNTPGVANGIAEAWVDGVQVLNRTNVIWQRAGSNRAWKEFSLMRQNGAGNFWWDRFAAGDTRIGCLGATPDSNPPASPQRLVIR